MSLFIKVELTSPGADTVTLLQDLEETNGQVVIDPALLAVGTGVYVTGLSQDEARELRKELEDKAAAPPETKAFDPPQQGRGVDANTQSNGVIPQDPPEPEPTPTIG